MVRKMRRAHPLPAEARIDEQEEAPDPIVDRPAAGHQRSVHGIMAGDEHPDREPAQQRREDQGERQAAPAQDEAEHRVEMQRQPRGEDRCCQEKPGCRLLSPPGGRDVCLGPASHGADIGPRPFKRKAFRAGCQALGCQALARQALGRQAPVVFAFAGIPKKVSATWRLMRAGRCVSLSRQHHMLCTSASTSSPRRMTVL